LPKGDSATHVFRVGEKPETPLPLQGDGIMHPHGVTLIYGEGGIGKGMISIHVIKHLIAEGHTPLVLDYEQNLWEWKHRAYAAHIFFDVAQPSGHLTATSVGPLLLEMAERNITHLVIDSASAAREKVSENDAGGADTTLAMYAVMQKLGVPILLIGHMAKSASKKNPTPMGSTHYVTQSRLVYHATGGDGKVSIKCQKANDRDRQRLSFDFNIRNKTTPEGEMLVIEKAGPAGIKVKAATHADRILEVVILGAEYRVSDVVKLLSDADVEIDPDTLRTVMDRMVKDGFAYKEGRGIYIFKPNIT
jgi:hypothetical protein